MSETDGTAQERPERIRRDRLDEAVQAAVFSGWSVESRSDFQAVLRRGRPVNHILHLILTFLTVGLWAIVWLLLVLTGGETREVVTVDAAGNVSRQRRVVARHPGARRLRLAFLFPLIMSRHLGGRRLLIIGVVVLFVGVAIAGAVGQEQVTDSESGSPADTAAATNARTSNPAVDTSVSAEERRKGFHCLSPLDGNHDGIEALIRAQLDDPGSMETHETAITPVGDNGQHTIRVDFSAKNRFGGRVRTVAWGYVDPTTCTATLRHIVQ